jgi:hypothetical protein
VQALDHAGGGIEQGDVGVDLLSMSGRSTLTTTSRPSASVAACTCAIEAEASGWRRSGKASPAAGPAPARRCGRARRRTA